MTNNARPYSTNSAFSAPICTMRPADLGIDSGEQLHHLDQAKRLAFTHDAADFDKRRRFRIRRAIEGADHRSDDLDLARSRFDLERGAPRLASR